MPNQNDQPQNITANASTQADIPPMPEYSATTTSTVSTPAPVQAADSNPPPPQSSDYFPPIVTTPPKKKFGSGKIIATFLGVLLLVGGITAGIVLTRQPQLIEEQASDTTKSTPTPLPTVDPLPEPTSPGSKSTSQPSATMPPTSQQNPTVTCSGVKAYNTSWVELSAAQLSGLRAGNTVNYCVGGTASSGSFDMAKFTINNVAQAETTEQRPTTSDYCQSYVIPAGVTTFTVKAQIHHVTLGWIGQ